MPIAPYILLGRLLKLAPRDAPAPLRYLGAALLIAVAAGIRLSLGIDSLPYLLFIPFIMAGAFWFGLGPGIFATLLSVLLAETLFVKAPAYFALFSERWVSHALFVLVNVIMAMVCAAQRRSLESLYRFAGNLGEQVTLRTRQRDLIWQAAPTCSARPPSKASCWTSIRPGPAPWAGVQSSCATNPSWPSSTSRIAPVPRRRWSA